MKNCIKQFLKAACYLLLFIGAQIIVTIGFSAIYSVSRTMQMKKDGQAIDTQVLATATQTYLLDHMTLITGIAGVFTILFLCVFFKIRHKSLIQEASIHKFDVSKLPWLIVLGMSLSLFISTAIRLLPIPGQVLESYGQKAGALFSGNIIVLVVATTIIAPVVEEIVFRGLILSRLQRVIPVVASVLISSLAFGLMHGQILWIAYAFVLGVVVAAVAVRTESVLASIVVHIVFNVAGLMSGMLALEGIGLLISCILGLMMTCAMLYLLFSKKRAVAQMV